ncbi:MAG: retropepsin-like domain-containing protein, partial [Paramuribaculum sp.]|nr:retropepsin-like domain-containing protein [Paramuribaculum sp.]
YWGICMLSSQDDMKPDRSNGRLCYLPILSSPGEVELIPGLRFKVDTGSDLSTITMSDLELLDSLGFKVEKKLYPVLGRDGAGKLNLDLTRYTVDLPLINYDIVTDSSGDKYGVGSLKNANVLHDVDFSVSKSGMSVLGIDFLEKFKLEYDFNNRAIALYFDDPDTAYVTCAELYASKAPLKMPMLGKRYSLNMKVAGYEGRFFIDSGIREARVKMPADQAEIVHSSELTDGIVESALGQFHAKIFDKALVSIGDRVGLGNVYFYDSKEEGYAISPFNLFLQNVLIDFPEKKLKLFPVYRKDKTIPKLVSRIELID